ncbi:maleylpyruvate isomerase family mycothiol-dependent enzyme [Streptomyces sp. NPDC005244]|uniref:maleylpyruvate isomerase family mycothiol-dependent enzyme n=1 Tax=Streptomyces sp. NPDC005244 TaxID=3364708 RepID=UPI0036C3DE1F
MSLQTDGVPDASWLGSPIDARPLFQRELASLLELLRALRPADWNAPAVPGWRVKDMVAHLLGDYRGRLGWNTDGFRPARLPGETLEPFIHRVNQEWVDLWTGHRSADLIEGIETAGVQVVRRFSAADLGGVGLGVSWAGANPAPAWLDIARELTEYWTHRQQIRHATGHGTDREPRALATVLDTFMRALPHTMRDTSAATGTQVRMAVAGLAGGTWTATVLEDRWSLEAPPTGRPAASVTLDTETARRLCTRGIEPTTALSRARIEGRCVLAEAICHIVSVVH